MVSAAPVSPKTTALPPASVTLTFETPSVPPSLSAAPASTRRSIVTTPASSSTLPASIAEAVGGRLPTASPMKSVASRAVRASPWSRILSAPKRTRSPPTSSSNTICSKFRPYALISILSPLFDPVPFSKSVIVSSLSPGRLKKMSSPAPPVIVSLPGPPSSMSLPPPPKMVSSPASAMM